MIFLDQFHFLRPYWLFAFLPLAYLVWLLLKQKLSSQSWEAICDKELLPYILVGGLGNSRKLPAILLALCGTLAILSLAGPVWEKLPQPVFSTQSALVIALDLSRSMDVTDISPSRLARARYKVADILSRRAEGQTALLVYAGDTFTVTPLTDDTATIQSQLMALTTDIMPVQGNRTGIALSKATELLKQAGISKGDILLITDEVDLPRTESIASSLNKGGYRLSILGVGTAQGGPIIQPDGGFFRDQSGQIVIPGLLEEPMRQLATIGGGRYQKLVMDDSDIDALERFFSSNIEDDSLSQTEFETDIWSEQGPWLVVLLIPLAALVFRKGFLVLLVIICLPYPQTAEAFEWASLWFRDDQRAKQALDNGEHDRAAELFRDPAWRGAANYRAGNFDEAILSLQEMEQIDTIYNLGNALARKGMYAEAIAAYDRVLEQNPEHEDALHNKQLLEKETAEPEEPPPQQPDSPQEQEQEQEQQDEKGEQDQGEQSGDQEDGDAQQGQPQQDEGGMDHEQQSDKPQQDPAEYAQTPSDDGEIDDGQQEDIEPEADEEKQATEQWLRRIPDDPGGLLRRKFMYQYQQRRQERIPGEKLW